jgi:hypothetical protein
MVFDSEFEALLDTFGGDSAFSACAVSGDGTIVAGDLTGQVHWLGLAELPTTDTFHITRHWLAGSSWEEVDTVLIEEAGTETVKLLSNVDLAVVQGLKAQYPDLEFVVRLFDDRIGPSGYPSPESFAERMVPLMASLRPYVTQFEVHHQPNRRDGSQGWGATDEDATAFNAWFLQVYDLLKTAHPWSGLGFPGLALPDTLHRTWAWLATCRPAVQRADWLGVHVSSQFGPGGARGDFAFSFGQILHDYRERFPQKRIWVTE